MKNINCLVNSTKTYWAKIIVAPALCLAFMVLLSSCQTASLTTTTSTPVTTPPKTTAPVSATPTPTLPDITTTAPIEGDAYVYPVQPGTPEWAELGSLNKMIAACQVPEDILKNMSTKGLVETVVNYPIFNMIIFHNDYKKGFEGYAAGANCVQELYTREDAATELLALYRKMSLNSPGVNSDDYQNMKYTIKFTVMDLLLAQQPIQDTMTEEQYESFSKGIILEIE